MNPPRYTADFQTFLSFLCHADSIAQIRHPEVPHHGLELSGTTTVRLGLHPLLNPLNPTVDIVAVHGLDGDWERSWQADNGVLWLKDLLPQILTNARIYSFEYDSRTRFGDMPLTQDIADHARDLVSALVLERELTHTERIPIIFIGHSLGGLVVKSALLHSNMAKPRNLESQKSIKLSTYGVLFLGTPHQGGEGVDRLQILDSLLSPFVHTNRKVIDHIEPYSGYLQDHQSAYNSISQDFDTVFFYETLKMPVYLGSIYLGKQIMVPKYSAVIQGAANAEAVPLAADHSTMAKFPSLVDKNFEKLAFRLQSMARKAGPRIRLNWERWNTYKRLFSNQDLAIAEDSPMEQLDQEFNLGLKIDGIRNVHFTGRQITLLHLDDMLRHSPNTASLNIAVLYGIGGIVKTQIALEYAYRFQSHYSAIFWIDGSREDVFIGSILRCLSLIKKHYEIHGLEKSPRWKSLNETLHKFKDQPRGSAFLDSDVQDCLKSWFSLNENRSWLLIVDNVDDLESYNLRTILPSTIWGSILVTTRRPDLAHNHKAIEVTDMDEPDALELLCRSGDLKLEANSSEWESGKRLVQQLGHFPLAIVGAAAYIKSRRISSKPVSTYLDLYEKEPKTLLDHRNAPAAWDYRQDTVMTTWTISYEDIREQLPEAVLLLRFCGFLPPGNIQEHFFSHLFDPEVVERAFTLLWSYSFLRRSNEGSFSMHPLLHWWIRAELGREQQISTAQELLYAFYRSSRCEKCDKIDPYRRHMSFMMSLYGQLIPCDDLPDPSMLRHPKDLPVGINMVSEIAYIIQGWTLWAVGKLDEAIRCVYKILFNDEFSILQDWELVHRSMMLQRRSMISAEEILPWTLCRAMAILPHRHPRVLEIAGNHAFELFGEVRYQSSFEQNPFRMPELWYQWLLEARTQVLGKNHPATAGAMIGLGLVLANKDAPKWHHSASKTEMVQLKDPSECDQAILYLIEACNIRTHALGYDDLLSENAMRILADVLTLKWCTMDSQPSKEAVEWFTHAIKESGGSMEAPEALIDNVVRLFWKFENEPTVSMTVVGLVLSVWPRLYDVFDRAKAFEIIIRKLRLIWEHDEFRNTVHGIMSAGAGLPTAESLDRKISLSYGVCYLAGLEALFSSLWYSITGDSAEATRWLDYIFAARVPIHDHHEPTFATWPQFYQACMEFEVKEAIEDVKPLSDSSDGTTSVLDSALAVLWEYVYDDFDGYFGEEDYFIRVFVDAFFATNIERVFSLNPNWGIAPLLKGLVPQAADDHLLAGTIHFLNSSGWQERGLNPPPTLPLGMDRCWGGFCPGISFRDRLKSLIEELLENRNKGTSCFDGLEEWSMCRAD